MPDEAGEAGNENFSSLLAIPQVSSIPSLSSSRKEGRKEEGEGGMEGKKREGRQDGPQTDVYSSAFKKYL